MGHYLSTASITAVFTDCVESLSGRVTDVVDNGRRLFLRSLLPFVEEVRPNDSMQGGIALSASESDVSLHPYLFREVCRNGAIMAQTIYSQQVEFTEFASEHELITSLRDAIEVCSDRDVFSENMSAVRSSVHREIDRAIDLIPMLSRVLGGHGNSRLLNMIFAQFRSQGESTAFGLMNAMTSVARDTTDAQRKWRLEELGGAIGAGRLPLTPVNSSGRYFDQREVSAV